MERLSWQAHIEKRRSAPLARWGSLLLCLFATAVPAFAATFTASLDRNPVTLGESVALSLTFEGGAPKATPPAPAIPGLRIAYLGPSSQFSFINGSVSSVVTHNFTVTPLKAGEFTIPAITADVDGTQLTSQPLKLSVLSPNAPPPTAENAGEQLAFLKLSLPKTNIYLGEVLTGELQFYFRQGVQLSDQPRLTGIPADGFNVGKISPGQQRQVQIGNSLYTIIAATVIFTPIKTGPLSIGPVTANVVVQVPSANRQRTPFGFFDMGEHKQIALATEEIKVQVQPLPVENVPADFSGAVGNYSLALSAGPTNVATGDPITVKVQIWGRGALDALSLPEQGAWHDFKTYPPTAKVESGDPLGLTGTKTFEQIVVPQSTDIKELPPFSFSFFDPDAKQYRTLTQPALKLTVRPGGATVVPVVAAGKNSASENPPSAQDIVPIKQRAGDLVVLRPPLVQRPWFVAAQTVPALAFLGAFIWRKRTDALANNPRRRRQRQVAETLRAGLAELRQLAAGKKSDEFFAELVALLQAKVGERLDCPASAITEAVIDEKLRPRGVPDAALDELHELFQACNLARYAPVESSHELAAIIPKLESVLAQLEDLKA